jgi:hypothetical protein
MASVVTFANGRAIALDQLDVTNFPTGFSVVTSDSTKWTLTASTATVDHTIVEAVLGSTTLRWISVTTAADVVQTALTRAQTLLGPTINTVFGSHFDTDTWWTASITGAPGSILPSQTERGGVLDIQTGATANNTELVINHGAGAVVMDNPKTSKWYMVARHKFGTAMDAQAQAYMGWCGPSLGNPFFSAGVYGSVDSAGTNYCLRATDNAGAAQVAVASSIAIDTSYHTMEMVNDGSNLSLYVDGIQAATAANTSVGTNPVRPVFVVVNGTTAANRRMLIDYFYMCMASQ